VDSQPTAGYNDNWLSPGAEMLMLSPGAEMSLKRPAMPTSGPGGDAILILDCSPGWPHGACQVIRNY
jgi:hypothetical protein